ncbi:MAG: CPBP family intramembrane metalloprotease, partial [Spirochaetales bacterium]|nr:CPBP family intramembrane metalloprotease [Spirochaetales bacterium]
PLASATQILFAMFFGVFFFALYYRSGSIIPGIILHALVDLSANLNVLYPGADPLPPSERVFSRTPESALFAVAITLPLFLIGLGMLRKEASTP